MLSNSLKEYLLSFLSLFGSASTLLCCALPALFVSLGAGATFASLVSSYPQLIWISKYKLYLFIISGILLVATYVMRRATSTLACPTDPKLAQACGRTRSVNDFIFWIAVGLYAVGFFFAFLAQWLL